MPILNYTTTIAVEKTMGGRSTQRSRGGGASFGSQPSTTRTASRPASDSRCAPTTGSGTSSFRCAPKATRRNESRPVGEARAEDPGAGCARRVEDREGLA